ncbi:MAG: nucleoside triphosphate pyrophosphohydrolase [Chloroflexi bacterium]|nr:nucleoside triphosphate pyrophosphohydrolase [Chloroflexota bacterium]MDL1910009.1 nucleoside triphosphate pyrophosphohydrolase [Chloroflexi bacterium CFX6]
MDFSQLASIFETLRLAPPSKLTLLDGAEFTSRHYPPTPPDVDTLILGIDSQELASQVKAVLLAVYPEGHKVYLVEGQVSKVEQLGDLQPSTFDLQPPVCLYIPSLGEGTSFESFAEIVAHLRAPDGCPWDREQTHQTLRKHLLEESYETLSVMDTNDTNGMREEFGDLLLQVVLNAQIASESRDFNMTGVIQHIYEKIIRRHPHVFGDLKLEGVDGVLQNWEKLKEKERRELALSGVEGKKEDKGILDGVPAALPALSQAQEYQERAARVGFDWPEVEGVLDKIREEIEEIKTAGNPEQVKAELGDLFFVLVNLARWRDADAESALREANLKFKRRFAHVEKRAKEQGRNLSDMTLEEMDAFWNEAKRLGM